MLARHMQRLKSVYQHAGPVYSSLYITRRISESVLDHIDGWLVGIEQKRRLVEPWTIAARRFTSLTNKELWNQYDWSQAGEEWTRDQAWKDQIIRQFLEPHMPERGTILEVGPGGGRWTEILQQRANRLVIVDVSERAIQLCRDRFPNHNNMEFQVGSGKHVNMEDGTVDAIWSYDVFVHINPQDARSYFQEFRRLLKPGGRAVIHHPGSAENPGRLRKGWRSDLTNEMVLGFVQENSLRLISQTHELVNEGDVLTVISS